RSLRRVAAHHAPSAANGIAVIHSSTIAYEGFHQVLEPSTAHNAVAGSAAPEKPTPISRHPQPRRDQSSDAVVASGASPPPSSVVAPSNRHDTIRPARIAAATTQMPPPRKEAR